jgi:hypothetical protein
VDNVFGEKTEATRRKMLIAKHLVLFFAVGGGTYWGYCASHP